MSVLHIPYRYLCTEHEIEIHRQASVARRLRYAGSMTTPLTDLLERQRVENARLSGQIVALEMAVKLLFIQHPNAQALAAFYSKAVDGLLDITLATRMPEEMRDALDQARNGLLEALRQQPAPGGD